MGPGETFVAIAAIIATCWVITSIGKHTIYWLSGKYRRKKPSRSELTTSELRTLVCRAVEEATAPLEKKIDRLERRLKETTPRHVLPPEDEHRFGLLTDTDVLEEEPKEA